MTIIVQIIVDNKLPFKFFHLQIKLAGVVEYIRERNYYYRDKKLKELSDLNSKLEMYQTYFEFGDITINIQLSIIKWWMLYIIIFLILTMIIKILQ